ncbi:MAG: hypothetical protein Q4F25_04610, partial [Eubacteriales bacterium]|nr:hypothetical protein [Eubacteriales bacterium]
MKYIIERVREYMKKKAVRARLRKTISVLCCLVVFVTTYAMMLPSLALEKEATCGKEEHEHTADCYTRELVCGQEESEEHQHTDECYEDVLSCGKEVHIHTEDCYPQEEPEEEEPEETVQEEPEEVPEEEPAAEENVQEEKEEPEEEEPEESVQEESEEASQDEPAQRVTDDAGQEQDADDDKDDENGSAELDKEKPQEKEDEDSPDFADPEKLDKIKFAKILTDDTTIYYLPEDVDRDDQEAMDKGWKPIDQKVKLDPEEEVLLHIAYEIPAGSLNVTNTKTEYSLPLGIRMTEEQVKFINEHRNKVYEGTDRNADYLLYAGEYEIEEKKNDEGEVTERKLVIRFNEYAYGKAGGEKMTDGTVTVKPEKIEGFIEMPVFASDLLRLEKEGDDTNNVYRMEWNEDKDLDTIIYFDEEKLDAFLKAQNGDNSQADAAQEEADGESADDNAAKGKTDDGKDRNEDGENVIIQDLEEDDIEGSGEDAENPEEGSTQDAAEQNEADAASDEEAEAAPEFKLTVGEGASLTRIITALELKTEEEAEQFVSEEVEDVQVSNPDLIEVAHKGKILWIFGKEDWTITAKDHFISRETLTVTTKDGEVLEIILTDAELVACEDGKTYEVTASGETYEVILAYGAESGLPAEGITLDVTEITPEDDGYDAYLAEADGAVGDSKSVSTLKLFDIKILVFGKEVEPTGPVNVSIKMKDKQVEENEEVSVLHFQEEGETEVLDSENVQVLEAQ